jgi:outer membrane protein TolC
VEAAEVRYHDAERNVGFVRQQVRQEIGDLVNRVRVAESRIKVLERAADVAKQGWEISLERFKNGTITRNDLTLAQQRLTSARMNTLNALVDYQLGLEDLKRRTLWDFESGGRVKPVLGPQSEE